MAVSHYYVDPAGGNDTTGDGSIGTPWATVQKALDTITQNTTSGDQINVKANGEDTLTAPLDLTTYGTPNQAYPITFRGYSSSANDGGIGVLDGDATYAIINETKDYINFVDMKLYNCGSATVVTLDTRSHVVNCEVTNTSGSGIVIGDFGLVAGCHVHSCGVIGISSSGSKVTHNYLANGTNDFTTAIVSGSGTTAISHNIIDVDGATKGISPGVDGCSICGNSIYSSGGTGTGIELVNGRNASEITNNLVEGFSDTGGKGISFEGAAVDAIGAYGHNAVYDCTTAYNNTSSRTTIDLGDNETLGASPFTNAASGDFTPVDTGNVKQGAYPQSFKGTSTNHRRWKGAIEPAEPAGGSGGLMIYPGMSGGFRG